MKYGMKCLAARRLLTAALCFGLCCTACGKQPEQVTGYENDEQERTAQVVSEEVSDTGDIQSGTDQKNGSESGHISGQTMSDWLGGTELSYENTFAVGSITAEARFQCQVGDRALDNGEVYMIRDTSYLPAWSVKKITKDQTYESEVVKNLLGDTAGEVHRTISREEGDSHRFQTVCMNFFLKVQREILMTHSLEAGDMDPYMNPYEGFPSWMDGDGYFWHTWEGKYLGLDYLVFIGYIDETHTRTVAFYPKNLGDLTGHSECDRMLVVEGDTVCFEWSSDETEKKADHKQFEKPLADILADPDNQYAFKEEQYIPALRTMLKDRLKLNIPDEMVGLNTVDPKVHKDFRQPQLLFYTYDSLASEKVDDAVLCGYPAYLLTSFEAEGINMCFNSGVIENNHGRMWIDERGVTGAELNITYDFVEYITDQVQILSFKDAAVAMEHAVDEAFRQKEGEYQSLQLEEMRLVYYPVESPDQSGEFTIIPAWEALIEDDGHDSSGTIVINAADGSLVNVHYPSNGIRME